MRPRLKSVALAASLVVAITCAGQGQAHDQVYRVLAASCGLKNARFSQSGFRAVVQGEIGLVTALHGVAGCKSVKAVQEADLGSPYINDLTLTRISVAQDAAFFSSVTLARQPGQPLEGTSDVGTSGLKVVGYPQESARQLDHPLQFFESPRTTLARQFQGSETERRLAQRGSPSVDVEVLMVSGALQGGYSGAPVLSSTGTVVGIANGGLAQGFAQIGWVIPFQGLDWSPHDQNRPDPRYAALASLDAASLFHSPWTGEASGPGKGASISGTITYNGRPATEATRALAVMELVEFDPASGRFRTPIPIDFRYDNTTGAFTILEVPPGKYTPFIRLEAGYPFHLESGGDFHGRLSGLNEIVVAPHDTNVQVNVEVVQAIRLKRPVDNQVRRRSVSAAPESFHASLYAPSAELFEWDPVPDAAYYKVTVLTVRKPGELPLNVIEERLTQPRFAPGLPVSAPDTRYMFTVAAYSAADKLIGIYNDYYTDGSGGWLEFWVIPRPQ